MFQYEVMARNAGYCRIAGIDEAGRGPLAGPVVASAVILDTMRPIAGLDDSKKLSERKREELFIQIQENAICVAVGISPPELIDSINILQATRRAMLEAVQKLPLEPDCLLIDGITPIDTRIHQQTIKKGDSQSASIAAASISAKVTRDRLMLEYDSIYPQYGFASHKGYGSQSHLSALYSCGPCPIHRMTFGGVKELLK